MTYVILSDLLNEESLVYSGLFTDLRSSTTFVSSGSRDLINLSLFESLLLLSEDLDLDLDRVAGLLVGFFRSFSDDKEVSRLDVSLDLLSRLMFYAFTLRTYLDWRGSLTLVHTLVPIGVFVSLIRF